MQIERIFLSLLEFNILIEESNIIFSIVFELIVKSVFNDLFFDLVGDHPRQKIFVKFPPLKNHVLEMQSDLFDRFFGICLQIAQFRVHIISL